MPLRPWNLPSYTRKNSLGTQSHASWQVVFYGAPPAPCWGRHAAWLTGSAGRFPRCALLSYFLALIALSWHYKPLEQLIPAWSPCSYPIDKTTSTS